MTLRKTLRDISHSIANSVCVLLGNVTFLRRHVPPTEDNLSALNDIEDAARNLKADAEKLEKSTRTNITTLNLRQIGPKND